MAKKTKTRNPQDTTLRNTRAANKKLTDLTTRIEKIELVAHNLWQFGARLENLERWHAEEQKKQEQQP